MEGWEGLEISLGKMVVSVGRLYGAGMKDMIAMVTKSSSLLLLSLAPRLVIA